MAIAIQATLEISDLIDWLNGNLTYMYTLAITAYTHRRFIHKQHWDRFEKTVNETQIRYVRNSESNTII